MKKIEDIEKLLLMIGFENTNTIQKNYYQKEFNI